MGVELCGVSVQKLEDPIQHVLEKYQEISEGRLRFDKVKASRLELTPDKPNSARSAVPVVFLSETIGTLYVIGFRPQDGTGDEKTYQLVGLDTHPYPRLSKVVPRAKTGIHSEAHLSVVVHKIDDAHADPILFGGSFDLLGLNGHKISKMGTLGHVDSSQNNFEPIVTCTTGYDTNHSRFGDPHSVSSNLPDRIQICAFLAITEIINQKHQNILQMLNIDYPKDLNNISR